MVKPNALFLMPSRCIYIGFLTYGSVLLVWRETRCALHIELL
jgi:hypothetical protein